MGEIRPKECEPRELTKDQLAGVSYAGLAAATTTLVQALEHSADEDGGGPFNCSTAPAWRLPHLLIRDSPEFSYRGLMVDAARKQIRLGSLKQFVVLCRWYKLNYLHLHLTDNEAFTFPSTAFPQLAAKSSFAYTLAELRELQAFAAERGVTCVGEMDVPGHSDAAVAALPALLGFGSAPHLGVVNFANDTIIGRLQQIFDEIDDVLPSPFVAIGGDEVDFAALSKLPEIADALKTFQLPSASDLYLLRQIFLLILLSPFRLTDLFCGAGTTPARLASAARPSPTPLFAGRTWTSATRTGRRTGTARGPWTPLGWETSPRRTTSSCMGGGRSTPSSSPTSHG